MKILVTGGAGFIGSHLCERLTRENYSAVVLDDLSTGSLQNIAALRDKPNFEFVSGSVCDHAAVEKLVADCDFVVHLAAAVGVQTIMTKPVQSLITNVAGTEIVLEAAAQKNKPILIASSSEVYGKTAKVPFREEEDVTLGSTSKIRWSYAYAKAVDECLALAYAQEGRAKPIVARFFNTTGPRQTGRYGMVLPNFVESALKNQPLKVHGDGTQSRCFGHVSDVVESVMRLMHEPKAIGEIFNIGNDEEVSILGLAERVRAAVGSSSEIVLIPYDQVYGAGFEDMQRRIPAVSKLESVIGFRPRTSLDQIIADVIAEKRSAR